MMLGFLVSLLFLPFLLLVLTPYFLRKLWALHKLEIDMIENSFTFFDNIIGYYNRHKIHLRGEKTILSLQDVKCEIPYTVARE